MAHQYARTHWQRSPPPTSTTSNGGLWAPSSFLEGTHEHGPSDQRTETFVQMNGFGAALVWAM